MTTLPAGEWGGPVYLRVRVRLVRARPAMSKASIRSVLVGELTGNRSVQAERLVQVIGNSSPLTLMVLTCTGAAPLKVTRLLLVTRKLVPLTANGVLPPAPAITPLANAPRAAIYGILLEKFCPGQKVA